MEIRSMESQDNVHLNEVGHEFNHLFNAGTTVKEPIQESGWVAPDCYGQSLKKRFWWPLFLTNPDILVNCFKKLLCLSSLVSPQTVDHLESKKIKDGSWIFGV